MNRKTILSFFTYALIGGICLAQTNQTAVVEDFKISSTTQSGKKYPQVNSEGRVRARDLFQFAPLRYNRLH